MSVAVDPTRSAARTRARFRDRTCARCTKTFTPSGPNCPYCPACRPARAPVRRSHDVARVVQVQVKPPVDLDRGAPATILLARARDSLVRAAWCFEAASRPKTALALSKWTDAVVP